MVTFHHCNRMSGHEQLKEGKAVSGPRIRVSCVLVRRMSGKSSSPGSREISIPEEAKTVFQQLTSSHKAPPFTFDHLPHNVITSQLYQSVNPLIRVEPHDLIISEKASRHNQGFALLMSQAISTQPSFQGGLPITGRINDSGKHSERRIQLNHKISSESQSDF